MSDLKRNFDVVYMNLIKQNHLNLWPKEAAARSLDNLKNCIASAILRQRSQKYPKFGAQTLPMFKLLTLSALSVFQML
jgi:hypothetical protein